VQALGRDAGWAGCGERERPEDDDHRGQQPRLQHWIDPAGLIRAADQSAGWQRRGYRAAMPLRLCSTCGEENSARARFCQACAAPLPDTSEATPEVRRVVTVVFADIAGSTAMGEHLDPEALRRVQARYFDAMKAAVTHHEGTVEKYIGDAVMAVFGIP